MISFYKDEVGMVMYNDNDHRKTRLFVIECPATNEDIVASPEEYASFLAETRQAPVKPVQDAEGQV